jgi:hypothetical protein
MQELDYEQMSLAEMPRQSTCFHRSMDTIFADTQPLQACFK